MSSLRLKASHMHQPSCPFCSELASGIFPLAEASRLPSKSRVIKDFPDFVLLPSLSPMSEGHVLLTARNCKPNIFAACPDRRTLASMIDEVLELVASRYGTCIMFEHGLRSDRQLGCGINHAHLHFTPVKPDCVFRLVTELHAKLGEPHLYSVFDAPDALITPSDSDSYLLVGTSVGQLSLWMGLFESQLVRKHLASALGENEWDWRADYRLDVLANTYTELAFANSDLRCY